MSRKILKIRRIKMNKENKFLLSQKAHIRLYNRLRWTDEETQRKNYHAFVYDEQKAKNRISTSKEKQKIFKKC
jgi:hypothetical protein